MPSGTISQTPISLVFNESEPSDTYYTTDGSTPTTASTQYQFSGFREQEGATLTFTQTHDAEVVLGRPEGQHVGGPDGDVLSSTPTRADDDREPRARRPERLVPRPDAHADRGRLGRRGIASDRSTRSTAARSRRTPRRSRLPVTAPHVDYYSTDNAGNVEAPNSLAFKVDAKKPTVNDLDAVPVDGSHDGLGSYTSRKLQLRRRESGIDILRRHGAERRRSTPRPSAPHVHGAGHGQCRQHGLEDRQLRRRLQRLERLRAADRRTVGDDRPRSGG